MPQEDYEIVAWLPVDVLPKPKQAELKKSEWGMLAVIVTGNLVVTKPVAVSMTSTWFPPKGSA